jgi:hypothetical protein
MRARETQFDKILLYTIFSALSHFGYVSGIFVLCSPQWINGSIPHLCGVGDGKGT